MLRRCFVLNKPISNRFYKLETLTFFGVSVKESKLTFHNKPVVQKDHSEQRIQLKVQYEMRDINNDC